MTFTDADPNGTVSDYKATIKWGDGTTSTGIIGTNPFGGGFIAVGAHRYGRHGTYSLAVTIKDAGGSNVTQTLTTITTAASAQSKGDPSLVQCATSGRADAGGAARRACLRVWAM